MIEGILLAVIMQWSVHFGVDPNLVCAIIMVENPSLNAYAVNKNRNGTKDLGIMQLNDSWFKEDQWHDIEINVYHGIKMIHLLQNEYGLSAWATVVAYNCGYGGWMKGPPAQSIDYAAKVWAIYKKDVK